MSPTTLAGTVQESKSQRQERLKSRFRDRGGIFVPSEGNELAEILRARGVNGESPIRKRAPRKKSAVTPKPRPSAASTVARSKTPRTGNPKRAARKSSAVTGHPDENRPPLSKKRYDTSNPAMLSEGNRTGMDTGASAGPSQRRTTAQWVPFADQLADAINVTTKSNSSGKSKRALGKRKAQDSTAELSRYSDLEPFCGAAPTIKSPVVLLLEQQKREKQDAQRRVGMIVLSTSEPVEPPALHELDGSDSESDEPLAKKHTKRVRPATGTRKKRNEGNENVPPPPTKSRSKAKKTLGDGPADEAPDHVEKAIGRHRKVAPDAGPPPLTTARGGVNSGGGSKIRVLQDKDATTNVPRKRKEHVKALLDASAKDESEHGPPRKKSRRADAPARSRGGKENKAISRSAREAASIGMDKPLPSPVKQPAMHPKPASKTKKPPSRGGAAQATRSRGLPLKVLRRIKANARTLPALDEVDDDDPIDFLRS